MQPISPADLCEIEAIRQLKARYFRFIDTKQWEKLRELFVADATYEGFGDATIHGAANFLTRLERIEADAYVIHHGHSPEIRILSADKARGIWAQFDFIEFPQATAEFAIAEQHGRLGFGHYEDEYVKVAGTWRISFMRIRRVRVDPLPANLVYSALAPGVLRSGASDWLDP